VTADSTTGCVVRMNGLLRIVLNHNEAKDWLTCEAPDRSERSLVRSALDEDEPY